MATEKGRREKTRFVGVYVETSTVKRHQGKPDKCFYINYKKDGKLIWEKIGWTSEGFTAAVASNIRNERVRQVRTGEELPRERKARIKADISLTQFFEEHFLPWAKANKKSWEADASRFNLHIKPVLGDLKLSEIKATHVAQLELAVMKTGKNGLNGKGGGKQEGDEKKSHSPYTLFHIKYILKSMMSRATEWGLLPSNPTKEVSITVKKADNKRMEFFRPEQIDAIFKRIDEGKISKHDPLLKEAVLTSLKTGLRSRELRQMKWADIDWANERIRILGKNGEIGFVFPPSSILSMLRVREGNPGDLVFPAPRGDERNEFQAFRKIVDELGMNDHANDPRQVLCFHSLRHTYASWLVLDGVPLYDVSKLMRHKSIAQTERYAHLAPHALKAAAARLDQIFQPKTDDELPSGKVIPIDGGRHDRTEISQRA